MKGCTANNGVTSCRISAFKLALALKLVGLRYTQIRWRWRGEKYVIVIEYGWIGSLYRSLHLSLSLHPLSTAPTRALPNAHYSRRGQDSQSNLIIYEHFVWSSQSLRTIFLKSPHKIWTQQKKRKKTLTACAWIEMSRVSVVKGCTFFPLAVAPIGSKQKCCEGRER